MLPWTFFWSLLPKAPFFISRARFPSFIVSWKFSSQYVQKFLQNVHQRGLLEEMHVELEAKLLQQCWCQLGMYKFQVQHSSILCTGWKEYISQFKVRHKHRQYYKTQPCLIYIMGIIQPGKEKVSEDLIAAFQYLKGAHKKNGDSLQGHAVTEQMGMDSKWKRTLLN